MIGGLLATPAGSAWARTSLRCGVADFAIILFLLALRRTGERAGRLAERLETMEKSHDVQRRIPHRDTMSEPFRGLDADDRDAPIFGTRFSFFSRSSVLSECFVLTLVCVRRSPTT